MYVLKYDDIFADSITNAYETYDKECEIKILVDLEPQNIKKKYNIENNNCEIYILVTLNKKYKNISFMVTELELKNGEIISLQNNYSFEEKELIRKVALGKMREEMFKKF